MNGEAEPLNRPRATKARQNPQITATWCVLTLSATLTLESCISYIPLTSPRPPLEEITIMGRGKDKIVMINILGTISWEDRGSGLFAPSEPSIVARVKEELDMAMKDKRVRCIILKVDSPGGLISASEALYQEIKKFRTEKGIPVISYISSMGASGAYYVIAHSDKIIASPGALVGSIGVYMIKVNAKNLSEKVGVEIEVIKAGEHKDSLLFHRGLTEEERRKLKEKVDHYYESFKKVVVDGRGAKLKKSIDEIADGSVFTPKEALELGLIDSIGDIYSAIEEGARMANLKEYKVAVYSRQGREVRSIWEQTYSYQKLSDIIGHLLTDSILILYLYPGVM